MIAGSSTPSPKLGSTIHLLGTLVTFKATAAETEGSFSLVEVATAVGQGTPPHFQRDDAEAFYILEGSYEIFLAGRSNAMGRALSSTCPRAWRTDFAMPAIPSPGC